jgi:hypothetical protein
MSKIQKEKPLARLAMRQELEARGFTVHDRLASGPLK